MNRPASTPSLQTGASLIEVLISVFVLAFGVLGIAAMQAGALRNNQGAYEQSAAVFLSHSILDAMRSSMIANTAQPGEMVVRPGYNTGGYLCDASETGSGNLAANDLKRWIKNIQDNLNGGATSTDACGQVECSASDPNLCTARVRWNSSRTLGGSSTQVVETRSRL